MILNAKISSEKVKVRNRVGLLEVDKGIILKKHVLDVA